MSPPSRKLSTSKQYEKRDALLRDEFHRAIGASHGDHLAFVDWLINTKRIGLKASSWRLYRAAVVSCLQNETQLDDQRRELQHLIDKLNMTKADPEGPNKDRTSAKKAKNEFDEEDINVLIFAVRASRSKFSKQLTSFIVSACLTGLRPNEWKDTRLIKNPEPGSRYGLMVRCAKHDEQRGHSEIRHILFDELPDFHLRGLITWLGFAKDALSRNAFDSLLKSMSAVLYRVSKKTFARRKVTVALYTMRHIAAANFKAGYIEIHCDPEKRYEGGAIVAALLGHATDLSASEYYARAARLKGYPLAKATAAEVLTVRPLMQENDVKWAEARRQKNSPKA